MFRNVVTGLLVAVTGVALSGAALAPNLEVRATPLCVQESASGFVNISAGPHCVPYPYGVNCQTTVVGSSSSEDTSTYFCVPRP
jgi:hypothetical protein